MRTHRRLAAAALVTATALALSAAGTAVADTNKSEQSSALSGPTAAVLSPAPAHSDSDQANGQLMDKADTTNWSLVDYAGSAKKEPKKKGQKKGGLLGGVLLGL
ncbi:hypothetical protein [Streptomyces longispororuber]|uniref:hypothetical protein n=1 Tax=Streptomyces longispororuber TaxID=68230 RepID=UPI0037001F2E